MKTKLFCLVIAFVLLLTACAQGAGTEKPTSVTETATEALTEAPPYYVLPDIDYAGESFNILAGEGYNESLVEGETGDALDDAKWQMQRTVEEALNVKISEMYTDFWQMTTKVKKYIMSGDGTYDAISMMDRFALTSAMENCFVPIQDVETINPNEIYWGKNLSEELTIGKNQYFALSSQNLYSFKRTACILWNTNLATDFNIEIPYDDVFAGTWTFDDFCSYRGIANADLNGDGIYDKVDQYTYGTVDVRGVTSQFWQALGIKVISKNNDDMPQVGIWDDLKFFEVFERLHDLMFEGDNNVSLIDGDNHNKVAFHDGRVMIYTAYFDAIIEARGMEDDFAVLPLPKYDESQSSYLSRTFDATFYMVPVTQDNIEFSGAVLDALSCVGYYDLLPIYVDTVLKEKASRDLNSKQTIQLCFDTRTLDMAETFLFDYFGDQVIYDSVMKDKMNLSSFLEKNRKKIEKSLDKIIESFTSLG